MKGIDQNAEIVAIGAAHRFPHQRILVDPFRPGRRAERDAHMTTGRQHRQRARSATTFSMSPDAYVDVDDATTSTFAPTASIRSSNDSAISILYSCRCASR